MTRNDAKTKILARRARFVAIAVASAGIAATSAQACGGNVETKSPGTSQDAGDAEPQACLGAPPPDASLDGPQPCLGAPQPDAADVGPQPCLDPPDDAGDAPQMCLQPYDDAGDAPEVCLKVAPDASSDA